MAKQAGSQDDEPTQQAVEIAKVATQIEGLDLILHGGLPAGRTTLISGGPGSGKSVLGLEFLYRGAISGIPGIFLTFEETRESIHQNALALGWDLPSLGVCRKTSSKATEKSVSVFKMQSGDGILLTHVNRNRITWF
jgi:KaiC/GvpD/RAD55 family RecA-like ATPase